MNQENLSIFPRPFQILSGSSLKLLACMLMLMDHTASLLLRWYLPSQRPWLHILGRSYSVYNVCRGFGRLAFPIFCFLIVEGFTHTHDRFKYGRNLLLFAFISEFFWDIGMGRSLFHPSQNVYFTLFFGYLAMCLCTYFEGRRLMQAVVLLSILVITYFFRADYSYRGYVFLMIMFWLRTERPAQALIGSMWLKYELVAGFAFIPINMYNGKRGFIKTAALKYAFYFFYPVHILILVILRRILFGFWVL